jgi:hypothetical protein
MGLGVGRPDADHEAPMGEAVDSPPRPTNRKASAGLSMRTVPRSFLLPSRYVRSLGDYIVSRGPAIMRPRRWNPRAGALFPGGGGQPEASPEFSVARSSAPLVVTSTPPPW